MLIKLQEVKKQIVFIHNICKRGYFIIQIPYNVDNFPFFTPKKV